MHPNQTLPKKELKALAELRKGNNSINLTTDIGVAMVVMDRKDFIDKATNLLAQPAFRTIVRDPINKLKAKLITIHRRIKRGTQLGQSICKHMYPMDKLLQSFMDFQRPTNLTHL